ncbi:ATP-grasp domain-containing protein [Xanthomonas translucens pv. translucens]|uniref:ATP-grasp domain-containing protein n=1 Tax=Xanthomonas campestris pv. translucens TaxID=343 RepID=UPI0021BB0AC4|nr:ATP-grasp domain-containing protein [Xanthomonas translucens]MCT8306504.1 ATP-grasp domain-containing protein [Xanthomonas translucens pv. translucens]
MSVKPLVILAHIRHAAVVEGFLPAAHRLNLPVVLLTDHRIDHLEYFAREPACAPQKIIECDVFSPLSVIDALYGAGIRPRAVLSNSDHLQTSAALVAQCFDLPGKDWRVCYAAKNKAAMRERLRELGLPTPWFHTLAAGQPVPADAVFPLVAKPREGVSGLDVQMCASRDELHAYTQSFWSRFPNGVVLLDGFLDGPLFSLETLGDGHQACVVGGFDTRLSDPPHFVELESVWNGPICQRHYQQALAQVLALGVNFGVCHSEFALTEHGPVLIEINYRSIGDGCEFMLDRLLGGHWFDWILRLHLGDALDRTAIERELATPRQAMLRFYVADREGPLLQASESLIEKTPHAYAVYRSLRRSGDDIRLSHSNKDYLGVLSVVADDQKSLLDTFTAMESHLHWQIQSSTRQPTELYA